ncbi:hypothetical protein RND81_03G064100 [Saponaria officinalis]|uniref:Myb-like domain-containing protein n=1 Tax=Saponaria officinalis TaxID=3572 RepID=A0AAW1M1M4_SAPOF
MLGSTGGLVGSSGDGEGAVGSSSIMSPGGSGGGGSGDFYEGDRSSGGNRWPRQETLALLKIRSDMDGVFRDSSLKGPLWEEISRKMAELGYHRSSKKCKEKFENVYKYHKRTKDGRVGKSDGKTYRFFDQLEALEQHHNNSSPSQLPPLPPVTPRAQSQPQPQQPVQAAVPVTMVFPAGTNPAGITTVTSSPHPIINAGTTPQNVQHQVNEMKRGVIQPKFQLNQHVHAQMENVSASSPSATPSSSSSTSSDEEVLGRRKRKRKWKDFFERLMKDVIVKQEEMQSQFLEEVERRERDWLVREEAWKAQEIGRLNREHEILVQERSMAAAKDAALIELLKKLSDQHQIPLPFPVHVQPQPEFQTQNQVRMAVPVVTSTIVTTVSPPPPAPSPSPVPVPAPAPKPISQVQPPPIVTQFNVQEIPVSLTVPVPIPKPQPQPQKHAHEQALVLASTNVEIHESNNGGGENQHQASSSRWPKPEVEALINLRTKMDEKYQENCPKGPLWEEISASMKQLGYNRNAKRCKEKWENINKYFKKVKESNKKRPEDSKTCPYFHQLDALYRNKTTTAVTTVTYAPPLQQAAVKPENLNTMGPIMAQPDQRWRHPQDHRHVEDAGSGNESDDDDDDDQGSGYEIVANNGNNNNADNSGGHHSMGMTTVTAATTTATAE